MGDIQSGEDDSALILARLQTGLPFINTFLTRGSGPVITVSSATGMT